MLGCWHGLVRMRRQVRRAWSQVDVQLRRRLDLIACLADTNGVSASARGRLLREISNAKEAAVQEGPASERARTERALGCAVRKAFSGKGGTSNDPLREELADLRQELAATERKARFAGQFYNDCVMRYNERVEMVPWRVIAGMAGLEKEDFFEMEDPLGSATRGVV